MTLSQRSRSVIGVALCATALTGTSLAYADPATPPPESPTSAPVASTPLALRPTKSLEFAKDAPRSGFNWKVLAVVAIGVLGLWAWRQRAGAAPAADLPALRILRRTSIGVRSELLVVEMEGQRLLLGVTPSTIQSLYIAPLADDFDVAGDEPADPGSSRLLRAEIGRRPTEVDTGRARPARRSSQDFIEEQARGISALAERK
jgi:flagellar protein FliO/FliZ